MARSGLDSLWFRGKLPLETLMNFWGWRHPMWSDLSRDFTDARGVAAVVV
jgi:hypothetical protein